MKFPSKVCAKEVSNNKKIPFYQIYKYVHGEKKMNKRTYNYIRVCLYLYIDNKNFTRFVYQFISI